MWANLTPSSSSDLSRRWNIPEHARENLTPLENVIDNVLSRPPDEYQSCDCTFDVQRAASVANGSLTIESYYVKCVHACMHLCASIYRHIHTSTYAACMQARELHMLSKLAFQGTKPDWRLILR